MFLALLQTVDREGRFGEWITSSALLIIAATLALPGDSLRYASFWGVREYSLTEQAMILAMAPTAIARMAVLMINGLWHRTPTLRGIGATAGLAIWLGLAFMTALPVLKGTVSAPSLMTGLFLLFALADLRGCYRAGRDDHAAARLAG